MIQRVVRSRLVNVLVLNRFIANGTRTGNLPFGGVFGRRLPDRYRGTGAGGIL